MTRSTVVALIAVIVGFVLGHVLFVPESIALPQSLPGEDAPCCAAQAPASTHSVEVSQPREIITRQPLVCEECRTKDMQIDQLRQALSHAEQQLAIVKQQQARLEMELEWRPVLQELQQSLREWQVDELQSVFLRSKLFPQPVDLFTAQGFVRSGLLTPQQLLELAQEASGIEAEKHKAMLCDGEQKTRQLAEFELRARAYISRLQQRGFGVLAENFRLSMELN